MVGEGQGPGAGTARTIVAIFVGVLVNVIFAIAVDGVLHSTGVFPPMGQVMSAPLFGLALAYRMAFAVAGGWVTSRLAGAKGVRASIILGLVGVALSLIGLFAMWNRGPEFGPKWYPVALVVVALPLSWLGGRLAKKSTT